MSTTAVLKNYPFLDNYTFQNDNDYLDFKEKSASPPSPAQDTNVMGQALKSCQPPPLGSPLLPWVICSTCRKRLRDAGVHCEPDCYSVHRCHLC